MGKSPEKERRKAERIPCKDVLLTYKSETGILGQILGKDKESKPLPVRNISRDGLCFLSKEHVKEGTDLSLTVDFGLHRPTIRVQGRSLHVRPGEGRYPHRVGVGFTRVSEKDWEVLSQLEEICRRRGEQKGTSWRLHHTTKRASRPGGALETPREKDREEESGSSPAEES